MKNNIVNILVSLLLIMGSIHFSYSQTNQPIVQKAKYFDISKPLTEMMPLDNTKVKEWKDGIVKNKFRYKMVEEHELITKTFLIFFIFIK